MIQDCISLYLMPYLFTIASSTLLFLASPGEYYAAPLMWCALVPLFWTLQRSTPQKAVKIGLTCGLFYYTPLLYWILIVLGTYGALPLVVSIPALLLLALYMSLYLALFAWMIATCKDRFSLWILAPPLWVALDYIRAHLFTGFPWLDLGYSQYAEDIIVQCADLFGHYGLTFLIVLTNALLATLFEKRLNPKDHLVTICVLVLLGTSVAFYSVNRNRAISQTVANSPDISVGIIQGNIDQSQKWLPKNQQRTVTTYISKTLQLHSQATMEFVVWPETALPFFPTTNPLFDQVTQKIVNKANLTLLTGAPHYAVSSEPGEIDYFNSAFLLSPQQSINNSHSFSLKRYDKQHLVPFGEYIPFHHLWPASLPLVQSMGNFTAGTSLQPIPCLNARIGVLICYESIFPDLARAETKNGATLLVNLTNDAWYGRSSAPWQQLAMAVMRSVENRRSLVRSANTGISCFVTPQGKATEISPLFEPFIMSASLPLLTEETFYHRFGFLFPYLCLICAVTCIFVSRRKPNHP